MGTATITVKYVNPPAAGKQKGSVKTADGQYFDVWADKIPNFQPNGVYDITYESREYNGRTYHTIKTANPKGSAPAPSGGFQRSGRNSYKETSARDAERMFVCSILKSFVEAGKVQINPNELLHAVNMLRSIWDETFGADDEQPAPQQH